MYQFLTGLQAAFASFGFTGLIIFCLIVSLGAVIYWILNKIYKEMQCQTKELKAFNKNEAIVGEKIEEFDNKIIRLDNKLNKIEKEQVKISLNLEKIASKI